MDQIIRLFLVSWLGCQFMSLAMLWIGARAVDHPRLRRLGEASHARKLKAVESTWPLTLLPGTLARDDARATSLILGGLIALKSFASFVFGILMVFWLPLASLVVPSIVTAHDPDSPKLRAWGFRVAALQVTSHALAAALGFALVIASWLSNRSALTVLWEAVFLIAGVLFVSFATALAAGRLEAKGLHEHGL